MSKRQVVLQRDVYDALELSALEFGGVGAGTLTEETAGGLVPNCIIAHAVYLDGLCLVYPDDYRSSPVLDELKRAFGVIGHWGVIEANDPAVRKARGSSWEGRIQFKPWCKVLNVVRGDA